MKKTHQALGWSEMAIDFEIVKVPGYRVATVQYVGPYTDEDMLRPGFEKIRSWAKSNGVACGRWIKTEIDGPTVAGYRRRWESDVELLSNAKRPPRDEGITLGGVRPGTVGRVVFNPEVVSSRIVYHALESWLEWRRKFGEYVVCGPLREIYQSDPWRDPTAKQKTEVQVSIKKMR